MRRRANAGKSAFMHFEADQQSLGRLARFIDPRVLNRPRAKRTILGAAVLFLLVGILRTARHSNLARHSGSAPQSNRRIRGPQIKVMSR